MILRNTRLWRIAGLLLAAACLALTYSGYRFFHPYDEVAVVIENIPANVDFVCVVADTEGGLRPLDWSLSKLFPFTMHPDSCTVSFSRGAAENRANVRWRHSQQIGVLCRTVDREWFVAWLEPDEARVKHRSLLFGGGTAMLDVNRAQRKQSLSHDQLRLLGMDYSLEHD
jgi:hypothetical protein